MFIERADGTAETFAYSAPQSGQVEVTHEVGAGSRSGIVRGTRTITLLNPHSRPESEERRWFDDGSSTDVLLGEWDMAGAAAPLGRYSSRMFNGDTGDTETREYDCCGLRRVVERSGVSRLCRRAEGATSP